MYAYIRTPLIGILNNDNVKHGKGANSRGTLFPIRDVSTPVGPSYCRLLIWEQCTHEFYMHAQEFAPMPYLAW